MQIPKALKNILEDNLSGSVTLLKRLMVVLENELLDPELDPATFISYIEIFRQKMETFTVIRHFCDELILSHNVSVRNYPHNYLDFIREYKEFWENVPKQIANNLQAAVGLRNMTVMLHSNSGTIREVFRLLSEDDLNIQVYQTLSAPAEEGRVQAQDLAEMGYRVTLIPDVMVAEKLRTTDYLILAADQIRKGVIINKTGSFQMALIAQEFDVPVVVLTESRKTDLTNIDQDFTDVKRDENEILKDMSHPNLFAANIYFEEVPKYMINHIITEKEVFSAEG